MSHQFSFLFDAYWEVISKGDDERRSWGLLVSPPSPPLRYRMDCDTDVLPCNRSGPITMLPVPRRDWGRRIINRIPAEKKIIC